MFRQQLEAVAWKDIAIEPAFGLNEGNKLILNRQAGHVKILWSKMEYVVQECEAKVVEAACLKDNWALGQL